MKKQSGLKVEAKANARTLCLSSPGVSLDAREGHFLLTSEEGLPPLKLPPLAVRQILVERGASLRTRALKLALNAEVPVSFFGRYGELLGHLQPPLSPRIDLRIAQYRAHAHEGVRLSISRRIVEAKILASLDLVTRFQSSLSLRPVQKAESALKRALQRARRAQDRASLLGFEGGAARAYFEAIRPALPRDFSKRTRRPPRDTANALLSYGYAVLVRDLAGKLELAGLDPYVGFLHEPGYGGPALALDLAESLRAPIIDHIALTLGEKLVSGDFEKGGADGVKIGQSGKAAFFAAYETSVRSRDTTESTQPGGSLLADVASDFANALRKGELRKWRPQQVHFNA